jgi:hypothetical protein
MKEEAPQPGQGQPIAGQDPQQQQQVEGGGAGGTIPARRNYDVDLLHPRAAHAQLVAHGLTKANGSVVRELSGNFERVRLNWLSASVKLKSDMVKN